VFNIINNQIKLPLAREITKSYSIVTAIIWSHFAQFGRTFAMVFKKRIMSLSQYKKKRTLANTPEPSGAGSKSGKPGKSAGSKSGKPSAKELIFVIQKHAASHLHYDFRLEMDGVLKSWAVPKGPSTDPSVKRLAMMVEDHPYDYKDFEGNIPKGNYGAGAVIVWDYGTYEPLTPVSGKAAMEKELLKELKAGSLKFTLHGQKLKGEYALVHTHSQGRGDNAWLLIKHRDQYAKPTDITEKNKSVVSGKTLEKVASGAAKTKSAPTTVPQAKRASNPAPQAKRASNPAPQAKRASNPTPQVKRVRNPAPQAKRALNPAPQAETTAPPDLHKAPRAPFPKAVTPMLATLVDKPFDAPGWTYEIKWDGYRALAFSNKGKAELVSRNQKSYNDRFYPILAAVKEWGRNAVLDGEIVVLNDKGISSFNALQNWRSEADGVLAYYVFDLLWLDGHDLTGWPLTDRRALLREILPGEGREALSGEGREALSEGGREALSGDSPIRESESFETSATEFLATADKLGLEGIIAKRAESVYQQGDRSRDWLKMKVNKRHEVVIGGYTRNEGSSKSFSSLLVGVFEQGKLRYTGKVGTGFSVALQKEMLALFKPLITGKPPFTHEPDVNKPSRFRPDPPHARAVWLHPKLVCEVHYTEITEDGVMRHPSFEGMREDKDAKDVAPEKAIATEAVVKRPAAVGTPAATKRLNLHPGDPKVRKSLLNPSEETQTRKVNGHELTFSHLSKVFWPKEGYTKRDLINYYYQIAPYILPYLKDRPQSLNRYPNGITGKSFYQKDVTKTAPEWMWQFPYHTGEGEDKNFLVVEEEASLLWMANLGAIEMNPWNSTIQKPDNPDWCIIDLDPSDKNSFEQVIDTAQVTRQILDDLKIPGYCKTSGSTGMHIYIPLAARYTYDQSQLLAKWIAARVHEELPAFTSIERMTNKRKGKLYVDYLQNRAQATLAAPYAVRPKPGATVSMPLHWEEVRKGLKMADFTMRNALGRIKSEGDIFKAVLGKGIDLAKVLKNAT
jgi:bifunctional non-homologous end joining protein LigD